MQFGGRWLQPVLVCPGLLGIVLRLHGLYNILSPGFAAPLEQCCPLARTLVYGSQAVPPRRVEDLTRLLLSRVDHAGSDVRVSTGQVLSPKAYPRQSAVAGWWSWKGVFSCKWAKSEHINRLELRSILLAIKWRVQRLHEHDVRFVHLTDSYICMSIIAKGRTSSVMLTSVLRQVGAWCLLGLRLVPGASPRGVQ